MGNARKDATLGMSHGTACSKLRKMILFEVLKRHNENVCVRCQKPIFSADELSIEHLKPWEGISAELFWSLDNIAFSHMACNRPHRCGPTVTSCSQCRTDHRRCPHEQAVLNSI